MFCRCHTLIQIAPCEIITFLENHVSVAQIHIFKGKLHPVDPLGVNLDEDVLRRRPGAVEKSHELTLQYLGLVTYQIKVYPLTFSGLVYTCLSTCQI